MPPCNSGWCLHNLLILILNNAILPSFNQFLLWHLQVHAFEGGRHVRSILHTQIICGTSRVFLFVFCFVFFLFVYLYSFIIINYLVFFLFPFFLFGLFFILILYMRGSIAPLECDKIIQLQYQFHFLSYIGFCYTDLMFVNTLCSTFAPISTILIMTMKAGILSTDFLILMLCYC